MLIVCGGGGGGGGIAQWQNTTRNKWDSTKSKEEDDEMEEEEEEEKEDERRKVITFLRRASTEIGYTWLRAGLCVCVVIFLFFFHCIFLYVRPFCAQSSYRAKQSPLPRARTRSSQHWRTTGKQATTATSTPFPYIKFLPNETSYTFSLAHVESIEIEFLRLHRCTNTLIHRAIVETSHMIHKSFHYFIIALITTFPNGTLGTEK